MDQLDTFLRGNIPAGGVVGVKDVPYKLKNEILLIGLYLFMILFVVFLWIAYFNAPEGYNKGSLGAGAAIFTFGALIALIGIYKSTNKIINNRLKR